MAVPVKCSICPSVFQAFRDSNAKYAIAHTLTPKHQQALEVRERAGSAVGQPVAPPTPIPCDGLNTKDDADARFTVTRFKKSIALWIMYGCRLHGDVNFNVSADCTGEVKLKSKQCEGNARCWRCSEIFLKTKM
eukprot:2150575-Karenia_brevis.AAC.1